MITYSWGKLITRLKEELAWTEGRAREITNNVNVLRRQMESLKIDVIQNYLEEQRKSEARRRGSVLLVKDKGMIRNSLLAAAGGAILGGLITRDIFSALNAGIASIDGLAQGLGQTRWYVLLGNKIIVAPGDGVNPAANWVSWESLTAALVKLKRKALAGEKLGNLDNCISKLRREKLVHLGLPKLVNPLY